MSAAQYARSPSDSVGRMRAFVQPVAPSSRFVAVVVLLALVSRVAWVLYIHPPWDYVYSDMRGYVVRAQALAEHGFVWKQRHLAWQAWGTHYLLAFPLRLAGADALWAGAVLWTAMGAAAVPLAYLLGCRVCGSQRRAQVVGVVALGWFPSLSNSGYFLSETPFLCLQLWSTYWLVVTLQEGKRAWGAWGAWGAGIVSACAFAVRPQSALFFVLALLVWAVNRRRLGHVRARHVLAIAVPLLAMLGFSLWRFEQHTGYGPGIAENANMNFTAGRCHNIVTQAFRTERQLQRSARTGNTRDGRRVSLPGYRELARKVAPDALLGLRPALGSPTIRFVGYVGDPQIHRALRRRCYEATGVLEQARYSMVNMSLLWFIGQQWPEKERGRRWLLPPAEAFKTIYQVVLWGPSMLGMVWALVRVREKPAWTLVGLQTFTSTVIAGLFFGSIRLRTPYDPYAVMLALNVYAGAWTWVRRRMAPPRGARVSGEAR